MLGRTQVLGVALHDARPESNHEEDLANDNIDDTGVRTEVVDCGNRNNEKTILKP